jgi:nucleotide-binding universal stress UspA family protein
MKAVPTTDPGFLRVLLTDEAPKARRALSALLATFPEVAMVADCSDGDEAVALVERLRPDVVVVDGRMTALDGAETARRIKTRRPQTGVVLLTTRPGVEGPADVFLPEDCTAEDLRSAVLEAGGRDRRAGLPAGGDREATPIRAPREVDRRGVRTDAIRAILVPTDFSAIANEAFRSAGMLAASFGARIIAVHVQEESVSWLIDDYTSIDELRKVAELDRKDLRARLEETAKTHLPDGVEIELCVPAGTPHVEISRLAELKEVDVIVMATHGRGFISQLLLGSTTEQVIKRSPCPVFVVRGRHGLALGAVPRESVAI